MANRQALRELQTRLAERLQVARSQGVSASWLAVEAGGQKYLFPLSQSGEIFPWVNIQPVPYTQAWFAGVANLRGSLYGVVEFSSFISGQAPASSSELLRADSRLVALSGALERNCALWIDKLSGLRSLEAFTEKLERPADAPAFFGPRYTDTLGVTWQEVDLHLLAQQNHFLSIDAALDVS
jgi:twitching motility protein PilI